MRGIFKLLSVSFLILMAGCATTGTRSRNPLIIEYDKASNLLKQGEYAKAKDAYQRFLNDHPESPLCPCAQYYLARCYEKEGGLEEALKNYQEVSNKYPRSSWANCASRDIERIKSKK